MTCQLSDHAEQQNLREQSIQEAVDNFDLAEFIRKERAGKRAIRHHYVPKFYLSRFAHKKKVAVYGRPFKRRSLRSIRSVAVIPDLYTVQATTGETTGLVEHAIGRFEDAAAPVIEKILTQGFPLTFEERLSLADYVALQYLRTPLNKRQHDLTVTENANWMMQNEVWTDSKIKSALEYDGSTATAEDMAYIKEMIEAGDFRKISVSISTEEWMRNMLRQLKEVSDHLMQLNWTMPVASGDEFITTDNPVVLWTRPEWNPMDAVGFANAEEIRLPLSPKKMLCITPEDYPDELTLPISKASVYNTNRLAAARAYKWIYQHPNGSDISGIIPESEHQVMRILN